MGDAMGIYQLPKRDLDSLTEDNNGGQTVAYHATSEVLKAGAASGTFLYKLRATTGVPMTLGSKVLGWGSVALVVFDVGKAYYKEGKEILDCQAER